jgi:hypothetical protein
MVPEPPDPPIADFQGHHTCAPCKGVDLQWVQFPPGNWVAPAGPPLADRSDEERKRIRRSLRDKRVALATRRADSSDFRLRGQTYFQVISESGDTIPVRCVKVLIFSQRGQTYFQVISESGDTIPVRRPRGQTYFQVISDVPNSSHFSSRYMNCWRTRASIVTRPPNRRG